MVALLYTLTIISVFVFLLVSTISVGVRIFAGYDVENIIKAVNMGFTPAQFTDILDKGYASVYIKPWAVHRDDPHKMLLVFDEHWNSTSQLLTKKHLQRALMGLTQVIWSAIIIYLSVAYGLPVWLLVAYVLAYLIMQISIQYIASSYTKITQDMIKVRNAILLHQNAIPSAYACKQLCDPRDIQKLRNHLEKDLMDFPTEPRAVSSARLMQIV
jgi:hypothetical protein